MNVLVYGAATGIAPRERIAAAASGCLKGLSITDYYRTLHDSLRKAGEIARAITNTPSLLIVFTDGQEEKPVGRSKFAQQIVGKPDRLHVIIVIVSEGAHDTAWIAKACQATGCLVIECGQQLEGGGIIAAEIERLRAAPAPPDAS